MFALSRFRACKSDIIMLFLMPLVGLYPHPHRCYRFVLLLSCRISTCVSMTLCTPLDWAGPDELESMGRSSKQLNARCTLGPSALRPLAGALYTSRWRVRRRITETDEGFATRTHAFHSNITTKRTCTPSSIHYHQRTSVFRNQFFRIYWWRK